MSEEKNLSFNPDEATEEEIQKIETFDEAVKYITDPIVKWINSNQNDPLAYNVSNAYISASQNVENIRERGLFVNHVKQLLKEKPWNNDPYWLASQAIENLRYIDLVDILAQRLNKLYSFSKQYKEKLDNGEENVSQEEYYKMTSDIEKMRQAIAKFQETDIYKKQLNLTQEEYQKVKDEKQSGN